LAAITWGPHIKALARAIYPASPMYELGNRLPAHELGLVQLVEDGLPPGVGGRRRPGARARVTGGRDGYRVRYSDARLTFNARHAPSTDTTGSRSSTKRISSRPRAARGVPGRAPRALSLERDDGGGHAQLVLERLVLLRCRQQRARRDVEARLAAGPARREA